MDTETAQCPPCGPKDAKIVIIGEAPGEHEIIQRTPFVGPSGRLLDQILATAGIDRRACYLTNVVKTRPPGNEFEHFYERTKNGKLDPRRAVQSSFLKDSIAKLHVELDALVPHVIVLLGNESLRAVCSLRGITKWRGSILSSRWGKCIPTIHPAAILREYGSRPVVELDIRRVAAESVSRSLTLPKMEFVLRPTVADVAAFLSKPHRRVAFDIETIQTHVRCLALSGERNRAFCIPFISREPRVSSSQCKRLIGGDSSTALTSYWTREEEYEVLRMLNDFFLNPNVEKIAQNFPFDSTVLGMEFGFNILGKIHDTMLKHHDVYPELPKGLDFLCSIYTRIPYYSDYNSKDDHSTWVYNSYDAAVTYEVSEVLDDEVREAGLVDFHERMTVPTMLALTRAQNRGVLVDTEERSKQLVLINQQIDELTAKIQTVAENKTFNPKSFKQKNELLYDKLGMSPVLHHNRGTVTTDKNALEKLAKKYPDNKELLSSLQEYNSLTTLRSQFLTRELADDGRIRTSFNVAGTVTGRLSSSESFLYPSTNLQNIQKPGSGPMRRCFVAGPGRLILKADLSQAEFRIVVWLAKIVRIIEKYKVNPNFDVHRWVASLIYRKDEDAITKPERDIAKNGVYGGNYSMHYVTAARTYKLPLQLAKFVLEEYRRAIPEIPQWWLTVQRELQTTRKLTNPYGRKRIFFGRMDDELFRSGYSHSAQSIVADTINFALVLADELFDPHECPLILQVHDELVFEPLESVALDYARALRSIMEHPINFEGVDEPLVIPADVSLGKNWYDQKKVEV